MCLCMCVCERDKCHLRLRTFFYRGKADVYNIHKDFNICNEYLCNRFKCTGLYKVYNIVYNNNIKLFTCFDFFVAGLFEDMSLTSSGLFDIVLCMSCDIVR